jgi:hypothetical protein
MEAVGIHVDKTCANVGIKLEWKPPRKIARQIGLICLEGAKKRVTRKVRYRGTRERQRVFDSLLEGKKTIRQVANSTNSSVTTTNRIINYLADRKVIEPDGYKPNTRNGMKAKIWKVREIEVWE